MVKNPPCNAGNEGSIPGGGTKIPHATRRSQQQTENNYTDRSVARHEQKLQTCLNSDFLGGRWEGGSRGRDMRIPTADSC